MGRASALCLQIQGASAWTTGWQLLYLIALFKLFIPQHGQSLWDHCCSCGLVSSFVKQGDWTWPTERRWGRGQYSDSGINPRLTQALPLLAPGFWVSHWALWASTFLTCKMGRIMVTSCGGYAPSVGWWTHIWPLAGQLAHSKCPVNTIMFPVLAFYISDEKSLFCRVCWGVVRKVFFARFAGEWSSFNRHCSCVLGHCWQDSYPYVFIP